MGVVLSLFAALALWTWLASKRLPAAPRAGLVVVLLLYSLARPICLDARMLSDSRYGVERWLADSLGPEERWVAVGDSPQFNVRGQRLLPWRRLQLNGRSYLRRTEADYVVVSTYEAERARAGDVLDALESGAWGYEAVYRSAPPKCRRLLDWSRVSTNLVTVDPQMVVFRRVPPGAIASPSR